MKKKDSSERQPLTMQRATKVYYLDFIRALSICSIITYHFSFHALALQVVDKAILSWGYPFFGVFGVSLFIILSGSSLMLSTWTNFDLKTYLKKRVLALFPLFWITYITVFLTRFVIFREPLVKAHPFTFILTIIGFDGFLLYKIPNFYLLGEWFLGLIIVMYIFFPCLRYFFLKYNLFTFFLCVLISLVLVQHYGMEMDILRFPPSRLVEFVFGMGFIFLFKSSQRFLNLLLGLACAMLFLFSLNLNIPVLLRVELQGISIFTSLACFSIFFDNTIFRKLIGFLSVYSYGAFLIHHIIFCAILPQFKNHHLNLAENYLLFFALLLLTYAISVLLTNISGLVVKSIVSKWNVKTQYL
jgi:peptidoglycan/LPS O-acetylase OafA/YrhL